jgi:hypothetical protein
MADRWRVSDHIIARCHAASPLNLMCHKNRRWDFRPFAAVLTAAKMISTRFPRGPHALN